MKGPSLPRCSFFRNQIRMAERPLKKGTLVSRECESRQSPHGQSVRRFASLSTDSSGECFPREHDRIRGTRRDQTGVYGNYWPLEALGLSGRDRRCLSSIAHEIPRS